VFGEPNKSLDPHQTSMFKYYTLIGFIIVE